MPSYPIESLVEHLLNATEPADFHQSLAQALTVFDEIQTQEVQAAGIQLVCRAGCSLCCSLRVDVHAHEVFHLAAFILTRWTKSEREDLVQRLMVRSGKVLALTPMELIKSNFVCALLKDGQCSVYEVRPHTCRRHHSLDLATCQHAYDHPDDLDFPSAHDRELFRLLTDEMEWGIEVYGQLGYDRTIYELGSALLEALTLPDCWERWRRHERAFLFASVSPACSAEF